MGKCFVNGREVELVADTPVIPQEVDRRASSPILQIPDPAAVCAKYKTFLEAVDAFITKELSRLGVEADVVLVKAEQHLPGQNWSFYYSGLPEEYVPVSLNGVDELEVPAGASLSMDRYRCVEVRPKD